MTLALSLLWHEPLQLPPSLPPPLLSGLSHHHQPVRAVWGGEEEGELVVSCHYRLDTVAQFSQLDHSSSPPPSCCQCRTCSLSLRWWTTAWLPTSWWRTWTRPPDTAPSAWPTSVSAWEAVHLQGGHLHLGGGQQEADCGQEAAHLPAGGGGEAGQGGGRYYTDNSIYSGPG